MFHNLLPSALFTVLTWDGTNYTVTAGTDGAVVQSNEIDMQGYDSLLVIAVKGTVTANGVLDLFAKCSNTSGSYGSGTVDKIGTTVTATDGSNTCQIVDFHKIPRRYVKIQTQRKTANVVANSLIAIRYNCHQNPQTQSASTGGVGASATFNNPTPSTT